MSTEASDSIAFSCWTSAPRRAIRSAATAIGEAREQDQPLRHERDDGGDRRSAPRRASGVCRSQSA